ncbi:MAG: SH3 domain-containing protein [Deltaproteobacteria bacterium]|nr:SH3 domain-containing protein [Deltaproteobacteria bacterium]
MTLQIIFSIIQIACLVIFLVLWRLWIKKKLASSFLIEDEDRLLFPFRYLSWILGGVVLITALAQAHFLWVSTTEKKETSKIKALYTKVEEQGRTIDEMKRIMEKLGRDVELNFKALKVFGKDQLNQMRSNKLTNDLRLQQNEPATKDGSAAKSNTIKSASLQGGFAQEAKASSASASTPSPELTKNNDQFSDNSSMHLSRKGKSIADNLRVRKQPSEDAPIVDRLMAGQPIKITEKKVLGEKVWFRVVTPSGKAGWVEFNYIKLEGAV